MTRLRFRVINITNFPDGPQAGTAYADLRALSSSDSSEPNPCGGGTLTFQGLMLEETVPGDQPLGGLNSSLSADTVTLITPLRPGDEINVDFRLGVESPGRYRYYVNIEVLP